MRAPKPSLTTVSMVSASQTPAATSAIASRFMACCRRLPTKPGMSRRTWTGTLPASRSKSHRRAHHRVAGLFVLDDLDQRHQMRRIPEMRADDALAMLEIAADLGRGNGRAVAGEDRVRRGQAFELGENLLLERQLLRRRLEHEGRILHRRRQADRAPRCVAAAPDRRRAESTIACSRCGNEARMSAIGSNMPTGGRPRRTDRRCRGPSGRRRSRRFSAFLLAHVVLTPLCFKELHCSINVIASPVLIDQSIQEKWSCLLCCGLHSGLR